RGGRGSGNGRCKNDGRHRQIAPGYESVHLSLSFFGRRRRSRSRTRRRDDRRDVSPELRSRASGGEHDEVITAHGGAEWLRDRGSAEWRPVGGGSSRPRHHGRAQLRREGEPGIGLWRGGGTARLKRGRREIYNVIEISVAVDTL